MAIEWDQSKNARNQALHGLAFEDLGGFDGDPVIIFDERFDYGEARLQAFGRIIGVGHCIVFTMRGGTTRLISFRKARDKEMRRYGR